MKRPRLKYDLPEVIAKPIHPDCAILCGGEGTRIKHVLGERPKALADVQGKPLLFHLIRYLKKRGVNKIVLCTSNIGGIQISAWLGTVESIPNIGRYVHVLREDERKGVTDAANRAKKVFNSNPLLVVNGDTLLDVDLDCFFFLAKTSSILSVDGVSTGVTLLRGNGACEDIRALPMIDVTGRFLDVGTPEGLERAKTWAIPH